MRRIEMVNGAAAISGEDRNRGILMTFPVLASKIVFERGISGAQQTEPVPATSAGVRSQGHRISCGDNREVDVLRNVVSDSVEAVDPSGAHRTRFDLTF